MIFHWFPLILSSPWKKIWLWTAQVNSNPNTGWICYQTGNGQHWNSSWLSIWATKFNDPFLNWFHTLYQFAISTGPGLCHTAAKQSYPFSNLLCAAEQTDSSRFSVVLQFVDYSKLCVNQSKASTRVLREYFISLLLFLCKFIVGLHWFRDNVADIIVFSS